MPRHNFDWLAIRAMYEAGESISSIGQKPGMPSKQAIWERTKREHWQRLPQHDESMELIPFEGLSLKQQIVIREMANGLTQRLAAGIAGVTPETISEWKHDPKFLYASQAAVSVMARKQLRKVTESADWRSGLAILERHPGTRDEFSPPNAGRGFIAGNTFNVLGHVSLGIDRLGGANAPMPQVQGIEAPRELLSNDE